MPRDKSDKRRAKLTDRQLVSRLRQGRLDSDFFRSYLDDPSRQDALTKLLLGPVARSEMRKADIKAESAARELRKRGRTPDARKRKRGK